MKTIPRKSRRRDSELAQMLNTTPAAIRRARYLAECRRFDEIEAEKLPTFNVAARNWTKPCGRTVCLAVLGRNFSSMGRSRVRFSSSNAATSGIRWAAIGKAAPNAQRSRIRERTLKLTRGEGVVDDGGKSHRRLFVLRIPELGGSHVRRTKEPTAPPVRRMRWQGHKA